MKKEYTAPKCTAAEAVLVQLMTGSRNGKLKSFFSNNGNGEEYTCEQRPDTTSAKEADESWDNWD